MKRLRFVPFVIACSIASALLAGCGGSQPPLVAPGTIQQSIPIAAHVERDGSWMLPEAKKDTLLYVSADYGVTVYSYPSARQVGVLNGPDGQGLCSDKDGNVFVTYLQGNAVYEYAHGATQPMRILYAYDYSEDFNPYGCSVDPTTNTLAVTGLDGYDVFFFKDETGMPTVYRNPYSYGYFCTYDDRGNFFEHGGKDDIAELPRGSSTFENIHMSRRIGEGFFGVAWDGSFLSTIAGTSASSVFDYRIRVKDSHATIISSTKIVRGRWLRQFTIYKGHFISPVWNVAQHTTQVAIWHYPGFGKTVGKIEGLSEPVGTTISVSR